MPSPVSDNPVSDNPESAAQKETPKPPTYLGDGVYISPDPTMPNYQLQLFLADRSQVIYLDIHVQECLYDYLATCLGKTNFPPIPIPGVDYAS